MAKIKSPKPKPVGLQHIEIVLKSMGVKFETEYRFHDKRMWRFDIAIPEKLIAIEYEGTFEGTGTTGKSRHTTQLGYTQDCDKYNTAVCSGWRVLRFTSSNYKTFYSLICILIPEKS